MDGQLFKCHLFFTFQLKLAHIDLNDCRLPSLVVILQSLAVLRYKNKNSNIGPRVHSCNTDLRML